MTAELYALDGWLANEEGDRLAALAAQVAPDHVIVELGSYRGKSACFLAYGSQQGNQRPVYCVDLWTIGGQWESAEERRPGGALHHEDPSHYETFKANTAPYADRIVEVNAHSHAAGHKWKGGRTIGLLFVDADHRYEATLGDLEAWAPHVAPGGWICCHDYVNADYPGVALAVDEFFEHRSTVSSLCGSMLTVQVCDT